MHREVCGSFDDRDMSRRKRLAILTGGGDVPGLNAVIKSFVSAATEANAEIIGLRRGWEALVQIIPERTADNSRWVVPLDESNTRTIDRTGGTILHTTRLNPARATQDQVPPHLRPTITPGEQRYDLTAHVLAAIEYLEIDQLVAIGGDGTLTFARRLDSEGVPVIAIPKTIDNDVFGTDYCVGFSTAITRSVAFINDLRTSAGSHERVLVVELFGRHSGETCLFTSFLAGADRTVLAEVPFEFDRLYELIQEDRSNNPSGYAVLTVSEGARSVDGSVVEERQPDAAGHRRLGGIGGAISEEFERRSRDRVIYQRIAYLMRSGAPDSLDQLVARAFGQMAADLALQDRSSLMVSLVDGQYAAVPVQITGQGQKRVDVERLYDAVAYRPKRSSVIGRPMFYP